MFRYLISVVLLGFSSIFGEPLQVSVDAEAVIVMNADTGAILYEKNSKEKMFPASVTKIATALYTLEKSGAKLDAMTVADQESVGFVTEAAKKRSNYSLPPHYLEFGATHVVIHKGEKLPLRDLMYAMMIHSADDASNVIAQHVGGTIPRFMQDLNLYLKELGCHDTHYLNPHGLHHPQHVTTAYDQALLTCHALKNRTFREIVATTQCTRPGTEFQQAITLIQGNRLLRKGDYYYRRALGVKTGFTAAAQHTLVAAAQHEGRTIIVVLLKNKDRNTMFKDAIKVFDAVFSQPKLERLVISEGILPYTKDIDGASKALQAMLEEPLIVQYYPAEEPELTAKLLWNDLSLPIVKGQVVGEIALETPQGTVYKSVSIFASNTVKVSFFSKFIAFIQSLGMLGWVTSAGIVGGSFWLLRRTI